MLLKDTIPKFSTPGTVGSHIWAKMYLMERNVVSGKFYLSGSEVVIDNSRCEYSGAT